MDIAYYLSELLEQLGEVNVPGLGSFTRVKVDGYYNSEEGRFYPPASKVEFNQQYIDDDVLARYIGVKKRISLASSKYFTEKYLNGLRQEIMLKEVTLTDVGLLYFKDGQICFKATEALPDPAFFGYPQIALNKIGDQPAYNWDESITSESVPVAEPEREPEPEVEEELAEESVSSVSQDEPLIPDEYVIHHDEPVQEEEPATTYEPAHEETGVDQEPEQEAPVAEEYDNHFTPQAVVEETRAQDDDDFIFHSVADDVVEQEEEPARSYKWLWISLIVLLVAGGAFAWFYYMQPQPTKAVKKIKALPAKDSTGNASSHDTVKTLPVNDTSAKAKSAAPVAQNTPVSTIDSTKRRYEVIGASVRTLKEANKIVENYKSEGIDAHIVQGAPGPLKKVSLGTYTTNAEAMSAIRNLLKTKKVKGIWPLPINPKK